MAYPKLKDEYYSNIGGINEKVSLYKLGENEVLDLINYDFSEPGAWSKRWGFTMSLVSGNTLTIGSSQFMSNLWQCFKSGDLNAGSTLGLPANRILFGHDQGVFKINGTINGSAPTMIYSNLVTGLTAANWNWVNYTDQNFFTHGLSLPIFKYRPQSFPSPSGDEAAWFGMVSPFGNPAFYLTAGTTTGGGGSFSGTYSYAFGYQDFLGFIGPVSGLTTPFQFSVNAAPGTNAIIVSGFAVEPAGPSYGFANYALFRNKVPGFPSTDFVLYATFTGTTFVDTNVAPIGEYIETVPPNTFYTPAIGTPYDTYTFQNSKYLEIYNNRLFLDQGTNTVWFSEIEEPEKIFPENNFVVSENRFPLSGFRTFNQGMMITCQKGIFRLTGDTPETFNVQTVSTVYGNISHKTFVEFEEHLWWLDESGPIEFNGSNITPVYNRMVDTFARMNIVKARENAFAITVKERNEVWFAVPIDGSNINNIVVVYDYFANAWTKFSATQLKATAMGSAYQSYTATMTFRLPERKFYYFGSIGASLYNFDSSLESDNGSAITLTFRTRWTGELGKSQTSQFRRFYLDYGPYNGGTLSYGINMYADYASLAAYSTFTQYITPDDILAGPQVRLEFGVPAKALSVEVTHGSTTGKARIYGYTIESQFQRPI